MNAPRLFPVPPPTAGGAQGSTPTFTLSHDLKPIDSTFEREFIEMCSRIYALRVPRIVGEPDAADFQFVADHMIAVADSVDAYFSRIGHWLRSNTSMNVPTTMFEHPCFQAISGNETFYLMRAAQECDAEDEE